MAQEKFWCKRPGTPQPNAKTDGRRFVSCLATSAWSPIPKNHSFKFIVDAIYLDYGEVASQSQPGFSADFEKLYHRAPSVHEVLPYMAVSLLKPLPSGVWKSPADLQNQLQVLIPGHKYRMIPGFRIVTTTDSTTFIQQSTADTTPARTLVTPQ